MRVLNKAHWPYSIIIPLLADQLTEFFNYVTDCGIYSEDWTYHSVGTSTAVRVYSKDREFITLLKLRYDHAFTA